MKTLPILLFAIAAAACGGKSKGAAPAGPAEGDDAATPFNDGAVKASVASMPGVEACGVEASTTMGAHLEAQRTMLAGEGEEKSSVEERFLCRARADDAWACEWGVFSDGGSGFIIMFTVGSDGRFKRDSIACNAPG